MNSLSALDGDLMSEGGQLHLLTQTLDVLHNSGHFIQQLEKREQKNVSYRTSTWLLHGLATVWCIFAIFLVLWVGYTRYTKGILSCVHQLWLQYCSKYPPHPPNKSHNKTKHEPKCIAEPCSSICDVQKRVLIITHMVKHHFYLKAHYNPNPHYVPVSITVLMCATMPSLIPISVTQGGGSYHWSDEDDMHKALTWHSPAAGAPWCWRCPQVAVGRLTVCPLWAEWPVLPRPQTPLSTNHKYTMVSSVNRGAVPYALWWQNTHNGQFCEQRCCILCSLMTKHTQWSVLVGSVP